MLEQPVNYNDPADFSFDQSEIEIDQNGATLKLKESDINLLQEYNSDTGFTYDNTKAEFDGGVLKSINQAPNVSAYYKFIASFDANYTGYGVSGTTSLVGTPVILAGKAELTSGDGLRFDLSTIPVDEGSIRLRYTIRNNTINNGIFRVSTTPNNQITIVHDSSNNLDVIVRDATGAQILNDAVSLASFNVGDELEIELNY